MKNEGMGEASGILAAVLGMFVVSAAIVFALDYLWTEHFSRGNATSTLMNPLIF